MTVANGSKQPVSGSTDTLPPLVAKTPPKFELGQVLVRRGYEDGWRWTVIDAKVIGRRKPHWEYHVQATRDYDAKVVYCWWPEWKLRPVPEGLG